MSERRRQNHIYGTVKVGDRGQVVIPSEARRDLNIQPGDVLLVLSGKNRRGIVMIKADEVQSLVNRIVSGLESLAETTEVKEE
ncbi:MAG: AbrB/MazE/SpoVT family DNA-binding domain-containing protein [Candidatus Bathyarchaeia archaeon]